MLNIDLIGCPVNCTPQTLPIISSCNDDVDGWRGRIVDIYFIPCDAEITEANLLDLQWWSALMALPTPSLRRVGMGVGTYALGEQLKLDGGGCAGEEIVESVWELTYNINKLDTSADNKTHALMNALLGGALKNYNVIARYCKPDDRILLMGRANLESLTNTHPGGLKEFQSFEIKLRWTPNNNTVPQPFLVPDLHTVLPI